MKVQIVLEPSDEGGYTVPALPGCISEGDTVDEAMRNIREAIELYLEPVDDDLVVGDELLKLTVPAHRPVKRSTLSHILKQARLDVDRFFELL
jgi:predicted RNase H-like HicB family nuclease